MLRQIILSFIPLFVAVDVLGNIPLFISLTEGMTPKQRQRIINESVSVATLLAMSFMFLGKLILQIMGITVADFKIAGGILLFIISVNLLLPGKDRLSGFYQSQGDIGVFPLGTPLITGPAVLTTTLILRDSFGLNLTLISLILNMFLTWLLLSRSGLIIRFMGQGGSRAFSKIADILLAAIAVMMIRRGIFEVFLR